MSFYLATLVVLLWFRLPHFQVLACVSAATATAATLLIWEQGVWDLGLSGPPLSSLGEIGAGLLFAVVLIGLADLLLLATTAVRHEWVGTFSAGQLLLVFIPAVLHEELVFRGYAFQKIRQRWRLAAIVLFSAVFALLHVWNSHLTPLALFNIFLGGVLLSLAYERYERLWFPIGLHLGWNLMSGPVLGHAVSGFGPAATMLRVTGSGAPLLTGGAFGLEGSLLTTAVEIAGIGVLWKSVVRRRRLRGIQH